MLGEIGGFLGLLGASVLTVCELVDYLALIVASKFKKKKKLVKVDEAPNSVTSLTNVN